MPSSRKPADGPDDANAPRPRPTAAERRRLVVAAARGQFRARGYPDATLDAIAEAAGLKPATVAKLFPDKPAVLAAVVDEFHAAAFVPVPDTPGADGMPFWLGLVDRFEKAAKGHREAVGLVLRALAGGLDPVATAAAVASLSRAGVTLAGLIRAGQAGGVVRRGVDPSRAAWEWLRALYGGLLLRPAEPAPAAADDDLPPQPADCLLHGTLKTDV